MAGYMFTLDTVEALHRCVESGVYSTFISEPGERWGNPAEGTFADYATMEPGDNVYFFIDRRIYGIGELVDLGGDCRYQNYPGASSPRPIEDQQRAQMLVDDGEGRTDAGRTRVQRWTCVFRPAPEFFVEGVDMDDALSSEPSAFRILRAIWKLSFIKFDDEENQAFKNVLLKLNQEALKTPKPDVNVFHQRHEEVHARIARLVVEGGYRLDAAPIIKACTRDGRLRHEKAIEAGLLYQLASGDASTERVLGRWDYLSHQVVASPFKPIDYMDKMDLFGYAWVPGYRPTIARYLVAELKKDAAGIADVEQTLKYVDWVKDEYAHGDYSMIHAYLIAASIPPEVVACADEVGRRSFTVQRRPARTTEWTSLRLAEYSVDADGRIALHEIPRDAQRLVPL